MGLAVRDFGTSDISKAQPIFSPLTLPPAPSQTRLANGAPGPKYWQNRSDYDLEVTLDTGTQMVKGSMTLRYTNNSPDVLKTLVLQNEQNTGTIDRFDQVVGAKSVALIPRKPGGDEYMLQVVLAEPLRPGKTATFQVAWHFEMPPGGGYRMGRDKNLYEVAQWYPRPSVYDDVKGWNMESYATNAEFYLDYGDYHLEVTLPAGFIVAATGTLDNPKDVLTATQMARLAQAATADTVIHIITQAELENGTARPTTQGMLTWKFHAKNTRDAAWATAPNYQWDATQWHGILAHAFYRPSQAAAWSDAADQTRMSIQEYSERWFPYPYPQATAVEGPVPGMEYPMLAMEAGGESKTGLYSVLTHEVGHNWFPMIVGSNERMHAWMDEGFNTFINTFSEARRYPAGGDQAARITRTPFNGQQTTIETGNPTGNGDGAQYFGTAAMLQMLRRDVLGEAVFDTAFKTYIKRWAFKHPTPMDFFRTMENVSGRKLDWFWRECFLESPVFDQAIDSVTQTTQGSTTTVTVQYGNKGRAVFPLLVQFTFSDGTTQNKTYPVDVWQKNTNTYSVSSKFDKTVRTIEIDPGHHLPDADSTNNRWTTK